MNKTPEHPEIEMALRTGYPHRIHTLECADCGESFSGDAMLYNWDGDIICGHCLRDRILENFSDHEFAEAFGISCVTVSEQFEYMREL